MSNVTSSIYRLCLVTARSHKTGGSMHSLLTTCLIAIVEFDVAISATVRSSDFGGGPGSSTRFRTRTFAVHSAHRLVLIYVHPRIDAIFRSAHKDLLHLIKAILTKVSHAKPRVLASSEKPPKTPRRTPRSPGYQICRCAMDGYRSSGRKR